MKKKASGKQNVSADELRQIKGRVRERKLEDSDYELIVAILETVEFLRDAVHKKTIAVKRLSGMVFGGRTEKTRKVLPGGDEKPPAGSHKPTEQKNTKPEGHGRNGVARYWGAERIVIAHQSLAVGDSCPQCPKGKLDQRNRHGVLVHFQGSPPVMEDLHIWLHKQFEEKKVEPNSSMGEAISYVLSHREPLTRFLRVPGAPLDNNIAERALKRAILHRKNSLFSKTQHGASVGVLYMSLIYTCMLCGSNPVDYLTDLERHAAELAERTRFSV